MTPAALRRLADTKLDDAASLTSDADRLRVQAAALDGLLDPLIPSSQRAWVGPAATDFETSVRSYGQQVDDQATRLRHVAEELVDRANRLRAQAASHRREADAAEAAAAATAAAGSIPGGML
jgi:hypothetical protein